MIVTLLRNDKNQVIESRVPLIFAVSSLCFIKCTSRNYDLFYSCVLVSVLVPRFVKVSLQTNVK